MTAKVLFIVQSKHIASIRLVVEGHGVVVGLGYAGRTGVQKGLTCFVFGDLHAFTRIEQEFTPFVCNKIFDLLSPLLNIEMVEFGVGLFVA